ncbi:MAG: protein-glutamate O-methyltransferase [Bryobacteraceae bacterium]|nr:protein-glutamate O-methyltransferase [Bryobacteraceae bacterium]
MPEPQARGAWLAGTNHEIRSLTEAEFEKISQLARERFGLDLKKGKEVLVSARLGKHLRSLPFKSFSEYYRYVVEDRTGEALAAMIDALTTNHTGFLREPAHFEFLAKTVLPNLPPNKPLRIWSAACSTGEEPYSIATTVAEAWGYHRLPLLDILATDISRRVLNIAMSGSYPPERFAGLPPEWIRTHVIPDPQSPGYKRFRPELTRRIQFRRLNLIDPFPPVGTFSVIFCRNVMIYFDRPTQERLIRRLTDCLDRGGYLLVGHSESLSGIHHDLEYIRPSIYRRRLRG